MGVAISDWRLAKAVSRLGQLGVVTGTGVNRVLASRLMDGDIGGHVRRALAGFALPDPAQNIINRYYTAGGKTPDAPYKTPVAYSIHPSKSLDQLTAIANFVEVFLAKEGHSGLIGINLLEKVQMPNLASLYGAMLAGVDVVLMGAGIPTQIPGILDKLVSHQPVSYRIDVLGAGADDDYRIHFDPEHIFPGIARLVGQLKRPRFLPIISSVVLAKAILKRSDGQVDGFVVEGPTAGGHNAPPRGGVNLNEKGEPIYGEKDVVDLVKLRELGLPFWLAGGYGTPQQVEAAMAAGAAGVQVGTAFSLCNESGMEPGLKKRQLHKVLDEEAQVYTSPLASPTGFPFKVAQLEGTLSDPDAYGVRKRICDLGFLRTLFKKEDGSLGYRCAAEPVDAFIKKGGQLEDTVGRACLCNTLVATAGFAQHRGDGYVEQPLVTSGDDLMAVRHFLKMGKTSYSAEDVITYLLGPFTKPNPALGA
ncbi:MAG: nitronate monooxygenase [Chloroflexi bacterium]|nr:nitronate monooxygenase [Chloroflexota bacterium]MCL5273969.1 nitronate monooxygenase [Chloroflexota bacterium]